MKQDEVASHQENPHYPKDAQKEAQSVQGQHLTMGGKSNGISDINKIKKEIGECEYNCDINIESTAPPEKPPPRGPFVLFVLFLFFLLFLLFLLLVPSL